MLEYAEGKHKMRKWKGKMEGNIIHLTLQSTFLKIQGILEDEGLKVSIVSVAPLSDNHSADVGGIRSFPSPPGKPLFACSVGR